MDEFNHAKKRFAKYVVNYDTNIGAIKLKIVGYPNCMGKGLKIYPKKIETGFVPLSTDHECDPITELEELSFQ